MKNNNKIKQEADRDLNQVICLSVLKTLHENTAHQNDYLPQRFDAGTLHNPAPVLMSFSGFFPPRETLSSLCRGASQRETLEIVVTLLSSASPRFARVEASRLR